MVSLNPLVWVLHSIKFSCVVELDKRCYCNLKVVNNSEHHAAFKVHGLPFHDQYFLKLGEKA
ncbi:hypothetical protein OsJ_32372 [Oryza sativa Japonica Group]|uniref:MSP domain-containing protein n=2 Tax=Oryza sativa subsp. japonica TaxID=39947 RepID=B9G6W0_ORYSJ|nr:hypothetical protein OsJ_32372 [Oryza sativa Japonica Group]